MALQKITPEMMAGKGVTPLPDVPALDAEEMKRRFEEIVKDVVIPVFNENVDHLYDKEQVGEKIAEAIFDAGAADMRKEVYDPNYEVGNEGGIIAIIQKKIFERSQIEHPVGSYYWSNIDKNPVQVFGFGTWERAAVGKVLVGVNSADTSFNAAGKTGGEKQITLTAQQMPKHSHALALDSGTGTNGSWYLNTTRYQRKPTMVNVGLVGETGGSQPHNNMPPFETAYCWKRTA